MGAKTTRVCRQVNGQCLDIVACRVSGQRPILWVGIARAETILAERATKRTDALETLIIEQHNIELVVFLDRGDDLTVHHQV